MDWKKLTSGSKRCRNIVGKLVGKRKEACLTPCNKAAHWHVIGELRDISYRCTPCKTQFDELISSARAVAKKL